VSAIESLNVMVIMTDVPIDKRPTHAKGSALASGTGIGRTLYIVVLWLASLKSSVSVIMRLLAETSLVTSRRDGLFET